MQNPPAPSSLDPPRHDLDPGGEWTRWLGRIGLGPVQSIGSLEVSPLVLEGEPGEPFLLLHEAIETGALEVREQGEGNVTEVVAHNRGDRPILILEGESVRGAKQNRVITVDVLVAAGASVTVFVGCVEQGRWDDSKASFGSSPMLVEPMLRAANKVESTLGGKINQGRLWRSVARKLGSSRVASASGSYLAFMDKFGGRAEEDARALEPIENQVGILALDGGRLVALDLLGHPRNWSAVAHRLAASYLLGGFDDEPGFASRPRHLRAEWLRTIAAAPVTTRPSAGLGRQIVLSDPQLVGGGLWHEGRPAHLAVFGAGAAAQPGRWVSNV
jgi:hypothetical protein